MAFTKPCDCISQICPQFLKMNNSALSRQWKAFRGSLGQMAVTILLETLLEMLYSQFTTRIIPLFVKPEEVL